MRAVKVFVTIAGLLVSAKASALQPLEEFLRGARIASPDNAEARAARKQVHADADAALGRVLPGLSVRGQYLRNQFQSAIEGPAGGTITITPYNQLNGVATLVVPLVDLANFARIGAARSSARSSSLEQTATDLRVQAFVTQDYFQLVANLALVDSALRALEVARASLRIAEARHAAGAVPLLDVDRARAEVERNVQQVASAELQVVLEARALQSATAITPAIDGGVALTDDLREEPPLERFQTPESDLPALSAAIESRIAAEQRTTAQRLVLVPTISGTITEQVNNFEGLSGRDAFWQAGVGVGWSFDLTVPAAIRAQSAAAAGARAREQRARLAAYDDIHRAWNTVRTNIARSRSARVQAEVSARAAGLALERYQVGDGTQLDLLQAQREAFDADARRIQADADLLNSRAQLRVAAGESLLEPAARRTP
jgi:outer membrane protein TolC